VINAKNRYLHLVYAGPQHRGFLHHLFTDVLEHAVEAGFHVDSFDLYAMGFDPVMSNDDLSAYFMHDNVPEDVRPLISSLQRSEVLFYIFPVWMYSLPSILKGYFEQVWRPNVSFSLQNREIQPLLNSVSKVFVICSSGQDNDGSHALLDLCEAYFEKLINQNTSLPATLHYLNFAGRDHAVKSSFRSSTERAEFDEMLTKLN
jgi:putative NADPH-quinone reductase